MKRIPNSAVVDGKMSQTERKAAIEAFRNGEIECLLNYGVFTEGTDLPMIRTVLLARPTQNVALYTQMVGRGLRLDEKHGKTSVKLIDCVGTTTDNRLCTAPTLFGLNEEDFPENTKSVINGSLMELEDRLEALENTPRGWVLRARKVDVINNLLVAWVTTLSGSRVVSGNTFKVEMSPEDDLGGVDVTYRGYEVTTRHYEDVDTADIAVYRWLNNNPLSSNEKRIWDKDEVKRWGSNPATASQVSYMRSLLKEAELDYELGDLLGISRGEASIVIANAKAAIEAKKAEELGTCPLCGSVPYPNLLVTFFAHRWLSVGSTPTWYSLATVHFSGAAETLRLKDGYSDSFLFLPYFSFFYFDSSERPRRHMLLSLFDLGATYRLPNRLVSPPAARRGSLLSGNLRWQVQRSSPRKARFERICVRTSCISMVLMLRIIHHRNREEALRPRAAIPCALGRGLPRDKSKE